MKLITKFLISFFLIFNLEAISKENYFNEAKKLYENKKYEESKFLFQKNIVFNPKDSKSYYYLAKIFEIEENENEISEDLKIICSALCDKMESIDERLKDFQEKNES